MHKSTSVTQKQKMSSPAFSWKVDGNIFVYCSFMISQQSKQLCLRSLTVHYSFYVLIILYLPYLSLLFFSPPEGSFPINSVKYWRELWVCFASQHAGEMSLHLWNPVTLSSQFDSACLLRRIKLLLSSAGFKQSSAITAALTSSSRCGQSIRLHTSTALLHYSKSRDFLKMPVYTLREPTLTKLSWAASPLTPLRSMCHPLSSWASLWYWQSERWCLYTVSVIQ